MEGQTIVTVGIFAYNHEKYIAKAIQSVLDQKCRYPYKILVCDDCSSDNTITIIDSFKSRFPEKISVIRNSSNLGLNVTFEKAINSISDKYVALLGGDDYWIDEMKLEKQLDILENDPAVSYVHTGFVKYVEEEGQYYTGSMTKWAWKQPSSPIDKLCSFLSNKWGGYPLASTSCFRLEVLHKGMQLHPGILSYPLAGEGTIINSSMCYYGGKYVFLPVESAVYTVRKQSLSHYEDPTEQFLFELNYAKLRMFVCREFDIPENKAHSVYTCILHGLLFAAYREKMTGIFRENLMDMNLPKDLSKRFIFLSKHEILFKGWHYLKRIYEIIFG